MNLTLETWIIILITSCVLALLKKLTSNKPKLPPGPFSVPVLGTLQWLHKSTENLVPFLRTLCAKYGPIITLRFGSRPVIFVLDRTAAYQALVQNSSVFSDRPPCLATAKVVSSNMHNITAANYGPNWRLYRRNLASEMLNPARVKAYAPARKRVLQVLTNRLERDSTSASGLPVQVADSFEHAMFSLLVLMCFGDNVNDIQMQDVRRVQKAMFSSIGFNVLNFMPAITKIIFKKKWQEFYQIRQNLDDVYIPLIKLRQQMKNAGDKLVPLSYVDTLLDLELPEEENRKLNDEELASFCADFLLASIDTTTTALQWTMANIVKNPDIQKRVFEEIVGAVKPEADEIKEEDLAKLPYLKAVILEGLRRHPPAQFLLPRGVLKDDVTINNFSIPKNASVNFVVADMGRDPSVWEDPMAFKPERFLSYQNENGQLAFDVACSKEVKMIPFGAGRRICPGYGLALLHLEYFVANLIWRFKWEAVDGEEIDLSEKQVFTIVMKNPLRVQVSPRA